MIPVAWNRCSNNSKLMNLVCASMILCSAVKSFSGLPGDILCDIPQRLVVKVQVSGHGEICMRVGEEWIGLQGLIMAEVRSVEHEP